jgi:hypothetical protein
MWLEIWGRDTMATHIFMLIIYTQIKKEMSTASMAGSATANEAHPEVGAMTNPTAAAAAGSNYPTEHEPQMQWEHLEGALVEEEEGSK